MHKITSRPEITRDLTDKSNKFSRQHPQQPTPPPTPPQVLKILRQTPACVISKLLLSMFLKKYGRVHPFFQKDVMGVWHPPPHTPHGDAPLPDVACPSSLRILADGWITNKCGCLPSRSGRHQALCYKLIPSQRHDIYHRIRICQNPA